MISVGNQIGRYKILNSIGVGGMGEVFLAMDTELERLVALKFLPFNVSHDQERIQRFIQEAKAASALNHPNILTIHEIGVGNGTRFIASEYINGKTLKNKLRSESLNLSEKIEIAVQISSALNAAHSNRIIHRDIKPENIMIRDDNLVKVLDFGLAKLSVNKSEVFDSQLPTCEQVKTKSGMVLGTVGYMSPEQARGKTIDHRTDIFSLGIVLYEMLTGTSPFKGETNSDIIAAILMKEPLRPSFLNSEIPAELDRIILKTLSKEPESRYQSVKELLENLKKLKYDLEFQPTTERKIPVNELADTKTKIFNDLTLKTINIETNSVERPVTDTNLFVKLTNKAKFAYQSRPSLLIILGLASMGFFAYFILSIFWLKPVNNAAVQMFNSGTEALREGTYFKASKMFEDAINIDNNFSVARAGLAEAWMELDYLGRAKSEILKVNDIESRNKTFFSGLYKTEESLYIEAINATVIRDFPQAVKIYQTIAERNPTEPHVYLDLGRAYEKNEEVDKAIENYTKAANINAQYGAAFLRLGVLLGRKGEYEKSNEVFEKAENVYDRANNDEGVAEVKFQRGVSLNAQEKSVDARSQFEQVINSPRANKYQQIKAMLQISSACCSAGNTKCAEENAAKAITIAQQERMENVATNGLIDLGNAFLTRGDYSKAEQNFQQALDFARKDEGPRNEARVLLTLASLRIQQKKPDEAQELVQMSLPFFQNGRYHKQVSQANLILGRVSEMKGDYNGALLAFEQVENSETAAVADKAYAKMVSGNVLMHQEKYPDALRRFEQSYDLYQSLNISFYVTYSLFYLSDVLYQLGRFEEARNKLSKAREIIDENDSLFPQLTNKIQLLNAQIALGEQKFGEAIKKAEPVSLSKNPFEVFESNLIIGIAQSRLKSKSSKAVQNCMQALDYAVRTKDSRRINSAKLALAQVYFNTGKLSEALETTLQAKELFIEAGQLESGWRAWLVAAQSSEHKGDHANARNYATKALETLTQLQNNWGQDFFNVYLAKPNINLLFKQANNL